MNNFVIQLALSMVCELFKYMVFICVFFFMSSFLNALLNLYRLPQKALKFTKLSVMARSIWLIRYGMVTLNMKLQCSAFNVFTRFL